MYRCFFIRFLNLAYINSKNFKWKWVFVMNRSSDFRQKEVINMSDGKRLGFVSDVEIDLDTGKIDAIILPGVGKLFGLLGKDNEFAIPWEKIKKIGEDIILVDLDDRYIRKYFD